MEHHKKIQQKTSLMNEQSMPSPSGSTIHTSSRRWVVSSQKTVSKLMDVAYKFTNGEDAYYNKRTRSPEDDRSHRYSNQRCRPHNYDNYGSHSQVAARYKDKNNQGDDRRNSGYRNDNKDDAGNNRQFRPRTSSGYNQSPDDMLNIPCHMHYIYIDGKRVSNHAMKDFRTFIKLQEVVGSKQAEARSQGYAGTPGAATNNAPPPHAQPANGAAQAQGQQNQGNQNDGGYIPSKGHIAAMIQPMPKSNKEQKSISRQVNLAITSPLAYIEYLHWSELPIEFSREDHSIIVPRPGNAPLVLKAQIRGYDVDRVFMDA
jgi:hypothetical protein